MKEIIKANHLINLLELLETERNMTQRSILRSLIIRYTNEDTIDFILKKMHVVEATVAADLFASIIEAMPGKALEIAKSVITRLEPAIQNRVCDLLEKEDDLSSISNELFEMLGRSESAIRVRVLKIMKKTKDIRLFKNLLQR